FILHHKDRLRASCWLRLTGGQPARRLFLDSREVDFERRAMAWLAIHQDGSSALLYDSENRGQPQAGAFSLGLGGEEWLEDVSLGGSVHAGSGVRHRQQHGSAGTNLDVPVRISRLELHTGCLER